MLYKYISIMLYQGFPDSSVGKQSACNAGDPGLVPGLGGFLGGRHGNPFQYSFLKNPMERGAWWTTSPWGHKESDTAK